MSDHRFDVGVVRVGPRPRRSEQVLVVKDVEPLILHGAHVKGGDGGDHENIEIVLAPERLLVPAHGALEAVQGVEAALLLAGLQIDVQRDLAARHRGEIVGDARELAADEREQIGGFFEGIRSTRCWRVVMLPRVMRLPLASRTGVSLLSA